MSKAVLFHSVVLDLVPSPDSDITIWPGLDPAHKPPPAIRLGKIEEVLQHQEALMVSAKVEARQAAEDNGQALLAGKLQQLSARLDLTSPPLTLVPALPPATQANSPEPCVGRPECFAGDSCGAFIINCSLLFSLQRRTFATEATKVAFAITHLSSHARPWGTVE